MVVFDATMLMLLLRPDSGRSIDSGTGQQVEQVAERLAHFVTQHEKAKTRIGLPTPALSEVLVRSGSSAVQIIEKLKEFSVFEILPFDDLCAIEVALMSRRALDLGTKQVGPDETWNKVKYDRQILATALVHQATALYTDDHRLRNSAARVNMPVFGLIDLPLPPVDPQMTLPLQAPSLEVASEPSLEEIDQAREAEAAAPAPQDG